MLVYVLIYLTGGVVSDCITFQNRIDAEAEYAKWVERQGDEDDVLLIACDTAPWHRVPPRGKIVAESYGEG